MRVKQLALGVAVLVGSGAGVSASDEAQVLEVQERQMLCGKRVANLECDGEETCTWWNPANLSPATLDTRCVGGVFSLKDLTCDARLSNERRFTLVCPEAAGPVDNFAEFSAEGDRVQLTLDMVLVDREGFRVTVSRAAPGILPTKGEFRGGSSTRFDGHTNASFAADGWVPVDRDFVRAIDKDKSGQPHSGEPGTTIVQSWQFGLWLGQTEYVIGSDGTLEYVGSSTSHREAVGFTTGPESADDDEDGIPAGLDDDDHQDWRKQDKDKDGIPDAMDPRDDSEPESGNTSSSSGSAGTSESGTTTTSTSTGGTSTSSSSGGGTDPSTSSSGEDPTTSSSEETPTDDGDGCDDPMKDRSTGVVIRFAVTDPNEQTGRPGLMDDGHGPVVRFVYSGQFVTPYGQPGHEGGWQLVGPAGQRITDYPLSVLVPAVIDPPDLRQ